MQAIALLPIYYFVLLFFVSRRVTTVVGGLPLTIFVRGLLMPHTEYSQKDKNVWAIMGNFPYL